MCSPSERPPQSQFLAQHGHNEVAVEVTFSQGRSTGVPESHPLVKEEYSKSHPLVSVSQLIARCSHKTVHGKGPIKLIVISLEYKHRRGGEWGEM